MQLTSLLGNRQRLDGGAMFGNVPRAMWSRWAAPDESNRIDLACRVLLIREDSGRLVLLETGIGAFFDPKMRERFGVVEPEHVLLGELARHGVAPSDIDAVVLSHLHFDHAGGLLTAYEEGQSPALAFSKARFFVGADAWARAKAPHSRDRASFIAALPGLLEDSGRLTIIHGDRDAWLGDDYRFTYSDGHTPGLLLTTVQSPKGPVTFMGDLVPGCAWVHLPITMGYDRYPELIIDEKAAVLGEIARTQGWAFYTHDPEFAASKIEQQGGKFVPTQQLESLAWSSTAA